MSKKFNNRNLLIILVILVAIFAVTRMTKVKNSDRTLNTDIVKIDTSRITAMHIFPSAEMGEELSFKKENGRWTVTKDQVTASADEGAIESALNELLNLSTEQLVARSKEKWKDYHVNDSLGTRVQIKEGKKTTLDMVIGKFDYKPVQNPYGAYGGYGQNQGTGLTYLRAASEDEVYAVEGFLAMSFNRRFSGWRDQTLVSFAPAQVNRIVFDYPADTGFIAQKSGSGWMVGGLAADSASMASYLSRVSRKRESNFLDGVTLSAAPDFQVTFEGESMQPIRVKAYAQPDSTFVLNSNLNPESWFSVPPDRTFRDLFKGVAELMPDDED